MAKKNKGSLFWKVLGLAFALPAGVAVRNVLDKGWERTRGGAPPENPAAPGTHWLEALGWAAVTGIAVAVARLIAARGAAGVYKKLTGKLPPGLEAKGPN